MLHPSGSKRAPPFECRLPLPNRLEFVISMCQKPDAILLYEYDITISAAVVQGA
jgi:hypothetical protein